MTQNHLEKAFLEELAALERFRVAYTGAYPKTPLSGEDPDVRRLLEGMAMFSARTRLAADRSLHRSILRIFRQHFSYLLGPLPAMAMLRAQPDEKSFVNKVDLPRGSEVLLIEPALVCVCTAGIGRERVRENGSSPVEEGSEAMLASLCAECREPWVPEERRAGKG